MGYEMKTQRGYDFYLVSSSLQKAVRRGDARLAGYFALELFPKYSEYCWKRLLTISAEDCYGPITKEIMALYDAFHVVNKGKKGDKMEDGSLYLRQLSCYAHSLTAGMRMCFPILYMTGNGE